MSSPARCLPSTEDGPWNKLNCTSVTCWRPMVCSVWLPCLSSVPVSQSSQLLDMKSSPKLASLNRYQCSCCHLVKYFCCMLLQSCCVRWFHPAEGNFFTPLQYVLGDMWTGAWFLVALVSLAATAPLVRQPLTSETFPQNEKINSWFQLVGVKLD